MESPPFPEPSDSAALAGAAGIQRFSDFDHLAAFYTGWNVKVEQSSEGSFQGAVKLARTQNLYVVEGEFSQALVVSGSSNPVENAFYLIEPCSADSVWWGRRFEPGDIVTVGRDTPAEYSSARKTKTIGVAVPTEALERAQRSLLREDIPESRCDWSSISPSPESFAFLARSLRRFMNAAVLEPSILLGENGRQIEQECLRAIIRSTCPDEPSRRKKFPLPSRSALVKRAEDLMRSQLNQPLGTIDLCHKLGVSDRTLRQAFRERYAIGPMVYYKQLRLNAVRTELKSSKTETIGQVARGYGFHHLSNFAADFYRAFGCHPSSIAGKRKSSS